MKRLQGPSSSSGESGGKATVQSLATSASPKVDGGGGDGRTKGGLEAELDENCAEAEGRTASMTFEKIRSDITQKIEELIIELNPSLHQDKASILARHLDAKLYKSSPSFQAYSDADSLDDRLRSLARGIGLQVQRRMKRSFSTGHIYVEERKRMLRKKAGDELYAEIMRLVGEVEDIRKTSGTWTRMRASVGDGAAGCGREGRRVALGAGGALHPCVTAVYFNTRLVDAHRAVVAKTSSLCPERVDSPDWEELAREARGNVEAFRELERMTLAEVSCDLEKKPSCAFVW